MNQPSDKKVFPMQLKGGKTFNIFVTQINKILGWKLALQLRVRISATLIVLLKMLSTVFIRVRITPSLSSKYRFAGTAVKVSKVITGYVVRMLMKVTQPFIIKYPRLTVIFKMILRMAQTIKVSRVRIAYTLILAQFILLGSHDYSDYPTNTSPRTLGNRDVITLGNMDGTYV